MSKTPKGLLEWLSARLNLTEVFSLLTSYGFFYNELDPRKPLPEALDDHVDQAGAANLARFERSRLGQGVVPRGSRLPQEPPIMGGSQKLSG